MDSDKIKVRRAPADSSVACRHVMEFNRRRAHGTRNFLADSSQKTLIMQQALIARTMKSFFIHVTSGCPLFFFSRRAWKNITNLQEKQ